MSAAGFYHCSVKGVGRAKGRSVVAAAAYRSGERLTDQITGQTFDYRARGGVQETFILAPVDAPAWAHNRERLWNEAERAETRANGRLATEFELALPHELDVASRRQLLKDFLGSIIERHGIAADVAIHEPGQGRDHRNVHAHVLLTHRALGPEGFGDIANTRAMIRKRDGKEVEEQVAGIAAVPVDIKAIRKEWEQVVNRAYEQSGFDTRVDHRSHGERGLDQAPTKHLGPTAAEMERRGDESERGAANREITQRNAERQKIAALEEEAQTIGAEIIDLQAERAKRAAAAKARDEAAREAEKSARDAAAEKQAEAGVATYEAPSENAPTVTATRPNVAEVPETAATAETPKPKPEITGGGGRSFIGGIFESFARPFEKFFAALAGKLAPPPAAPKDQTEPNDAAGQAAERPADLWEPATATEPERRPEPSREQIEEQQRQRDLDLRRGLPDLIREARERGERERGHERER